MSDLELIRRRLEAMRTGPVTQYTRVMEVEGIQASNCPAMRRLTNAVTPEVVDAIVAQWYREDVRALLEVLDSPTDAMIEAAATGYDSEGIGITRGDAKNVWKAMVEAVEKW